MSQGRPQPPMEQRVLHFIQAHGLLPGHRPLLVAVSGGPDSVCLVHILVGLGRELGITLHLAHLNHQLRGAESEADAWYVAELARRLGIPATLEKRDVTAYQSRMRISLEEAAREVRYAFLSEVAKSIGADRVAVGHTLDDNVETVLMHLIRGTGTRGLRGLQPCSKWQSKTNSLIVVRPLLEVSREETAGYCHRQGLEPRIDASNLSLSPLRNRIRHQLLPLLRSYNQRVDDAILRTARIASDDLDFMDREIARVWDKICQQQEKAIVLDREAFGQLPSALKRHLLRASIERLSGNIMDIETRHIEQIMSALAKPAGKRLDLPGGLIFAIDYDKYRLGQDPAALSPFPALSGEFRLKVPGETSLPGWRVKASIRDRSIVKGKSEGALAPSETTTLLPLDKGKGIKGIGLPSNLFTACFDLEQAGSNLVVRSRRPGDRFQPLGMSQPKKLNEFMIDAKVPRAWRQQIPIVCSPDHILWVVGWRIDDRAKVTEKTKQVLCLEFSRK